MNFQTCRLCHKTTFETPDQRMVRYGTRSWAHWACGFEHFGIFEFMTKLSPAQIAQVPNGLVQSNELLRRYMQRWEAQ